MSTRTASIALAAHGDSIADAMSAIRKIRVRAARAASRLDLLFTLEGELSRLRLPPPREPARTDALWRSTCFEAFATEREAPGYCELNVAPSHAWALYRFVRYREPASPVAPAVAAPHIASTRRDDMFELHATVELAGLLERNAAWQLALTAVIEDRDGRLTYWSARHAPGKPDFHTREAFAVELTA